MELGVIGLGKMGANIAAHLVEQGHRVVGCDIDECAGERARRLGVEMADSIRSLAGMLKPPRILWIMVPSGALTDACLREALDVLDANDIVIDAGNSFYRDSIDHARKADKCDVRFLDVGTSGGKAGARYGACLMVGGDRAAFEHVRPMLEDLAVADGCLYTGAAGSGHFMKMVHNGIEYGMMQAIGEGMEVMRQSDYDFDLPAVARNWNHGSVIRGWLMELMEQQLRAHPGLTDIKGIVASSGEAKWAVRTALEMEVPVPVIALSLMVRNASQERDSFTCKALAALRNGFGGHPYVPAAAGGSSVEVSESKGGEDRSEKEGS